MLAFFWMDAVKEDPPPGHCDRYVICTFYLFSNSATQSETNHLFTLKPEK
jgi:hypothetical protein